MEPLERAGLDPRSLHGADAVSSRTNGQDYVSLLLRPWSSAEDYLIRGSGRGGAC